MSSMITGGKRGGVGVKSTTEEQHKEKVNFCTWLHLGPQAHCIYTRTSMAYVPVQTQVSHNQVKTQQKVIATWQVDAKDCKLYEKQK